MLTKWTPKGSITRRSSRYVIEQCVRVNNLNHCEEPNLLYMLCAFAEIPFSPFLNLCLLIGLLFRKNHHDPTRSKSNTAGNGFGPSSFSQAAGLIMEPSPTCRVVVAR